MDKATIQQKLEIAQAFFNEVPVHLRNRFYNTAINRLYYGCFYATQALLLTMSLTPKTHKGVAQLLHKHFVSKGLFDKAKAEFFSDLLKERLEGDYGDFLIIDEEEIKDFIQPGKEYIEYVTKMAEGNLAE